MAKEEKGLELSGKEMVALAGSIAIYLSCKLTPREVCLMRTFFQSLASNLSTIEFTDTVCKSRKN